MKISTKGRYGLRVLLDIATHQDKGPVILRDISTRQGISEKYLWQVVNPLKAAGLLNSTRGAKGGYELARAATEISLLDVVQVLEGAVCFVDCVGAPGQCERSEDCVTRDVWATLSEKMKDAMRQISLKNLIDKQRDRDSRANLTYVI